MQKKILLSLALIMSLSADFYDRDGEEFETIFGTVMRSATKLFANVNEGGEIKVLQKNKAGVLSFKAGENLGGFTFRDRLLLTQKMTREQFVQVLAAYMD